MRACFEELRTRDGTSEPRLKLSKTHVLAFSFCEDSWDMLRRFQALLDKVECTSRIIEVPWFPTKGHVLVYQTRVEDPVPFQ